MARRGSRGGKGRNKGKAVSAGAPVAPGAQNYSGFDGARNGPQRGRVIWKTLDTSKEVAPHDRMELMRKTRYAEANIGLVRRGIGGVSSLIGTLRPQSKSGDAEFRMRAEEAFHRRADNPASFDMAGKMDFLGWQDMVKRAKKRDGDALSVLATGREGGAKIIFYEAHQVGNGRQSGDLPQNLRDGVFLDKWGGRSGFRLLDADGIAAGLVTRERSIYHADMERSGRPREISSMAHALSNVFDQMEILGFTKHAIKASSIWGAVLETSMEGDGGKQVGKDLKAMWGADGGAAGPDPDGSVITMESIQQGGRFHGLNPGQSIKTIQDQRPHPNILNMMGWLTRDIAWGAGLAPEVLWDPSGLNGTSIRYIMAETRRWIENEQRKLARDCQRIWVYFLSKEIKAGRLELPADGGDRWWDCEWIPQSDLTIDEGRVGNLELKQVEAGFKTDKRVYAPRGLDWEEEYRQGQIEKKRKAEIYKEVHGVDLVDEESHAEQQSS